MDAARLADVPQPRDRLRVPVPPPAARVHRARERDDAGPDHAPVARRRARARGGDVDAGWGWPPRLTHRPGRAVGRRAAAGGAGARAAACGRGCCWPTSRPATWTPRPGARCTSCSSSSIASCEMTILIVTHNDELAAQDASQAAHGRRRDRRAGVTPLAMGPFRWLVLGAAVLAPERCVRRRGARGDRRRGGRASRSRRDGREARRRRTRRRRAPTPSLRVTKLQFRGNRKVEDDAIKVNLKTAAGVTLTQEMVREDVRTIWKMGFFDDVQVEVAEGKARQRRHLRAAREARDQEDLRRRQRRGRAVEDQRGPRHQEGADPRPRQAQEERREDQGSLRREGLLHGRGDLRGQARHLVHRRRLVPRQRTRQGRGPARELRRQHARSPTRSCAT